MMACDAVSQLARLLAADNEVLQHLQRHQMMIGVI